MDFNIAEFAQLIAGKENSPAKVSECKIAEGRFPKSTPIGMMYVPFQKWEEPYEPEVAISRGTMFPDLDLPFLGKEVE